MRNDPPRRRWRERFVALTLIAVRRYACRTYYVEPGATQTPQVITAEETTGKVIPATSDQHSGKLIQDRVGAPRSGERMAPSQLPPRDTGDPKRITTLAIRPDG